MGLGVVCVDYCGQNGVNYSQRDSFSPLGWGIYDTVGFELSGEALVETSVSLWVRGGSGIGQAIQEVGHCNIPPCLINLLFPKSVHMVLGVPGVMDPVAGDLEEFDVMDVCILEIRIGQQSGIEFSPLHL